MIACILKSFSIGFHLVFFFTETDTHFLLMDLNDFCLWYYDRHTLQI